MPEIWDTRFTIAVELRGFQGRRRASPPVQLCSLINYATTRSSSRSDYQNMKRCDKVMKAERLTSICLSWTQIRTTERMLQCCHNQQWRQHQKPRMKYPVSPQPTSTSISVTDQSTPIGIVYVNTGNAFPTWRLPGQFASADTNTAVTQWMQQVQWTQKPLKIHVQQVPCGRHEPHIQWIHMNSEPNAPMESCSTISTNRDTHYGSSSTFTWVYKQP